VTVLDALAPDVLLLNGCLLTMDAQGSRAEALAVRHGRIVAVGSTAELRELGGRRTQVVDLAGRAAIPGLVDPHLHLASHAPLRQLVDVRYWFTQVRSNVDVLAALRARALTTPPGEWVAGFGSPLQDLRMAERRRLTRDELDEFVPDHPCYVNYGAHITMVNSKALEARGITRNTPDPDGGTIERDPASGEPTGILKERAQFLVRPHHPHATPLDLQRYIVEELEACRRRGVTTVHDMVVSREEIQAYLALEREGRLPIRVQLIVRVIESAVSKESLLDLGFLQGFGSEWLRLGGVKMSIDGGTTGRNGAFSEPLIGESNNAGIVRIEQDELDDTIWRYHELGMRCCVHAVGDVAHRMALSAFEKALTRLPRPDHRHRVEHLGNWLFTPDEVAWAKRLQVLPMPNPTGLRYVADVYKPLMGPERMRWAYRFGTVLREGFRSVFGSDGPGAYPVDVLRDIGTCVSRRTLAGDVINPEEAISVEDGLRAQTANAAYVGFVERDAGSLEVGKLADVTVLGADPFTFPPERFEELPVDLVMVSGQLTEVRSSQPAAVGS
jgi:predicted amidohydrolase YtcJ